MIFYTETGNPDGRLILFIHGGFTSGISFEKQYGILPEYRCVYPDLPGYGKSDGRFSVEEAAGALINLMAELSSDEKVILIAHSYGGLTAKRILSLCPDRIAGMIVGSTNIRRSLLFRLYCSKLGCLILQKQNRERFMQEHIGKQLIADTQKSAWESFTDKELKNLPDIPALFLYAEHDISQIKSSMKHWHSLIRGSKLREIKDSGHNYFWDSPEQVNGLVQEFVRSDISTPDGTGDSVQYLV